MRTLAIAFSISFLAGGLRGQVTERVSLGTNGAQSGTGAEIPSPVGAVISGDGRYVLFTSYDSNLVPGDMNATWDVFIRDRLLSTTERVSVDAAGGDSNGVSGEFSIAITRDGRFVAFDGRASNLVAGDTNGARDIFVRDRLLGTTERVSVDSLGVQGNGNCFHVSITPDGRFVAFESVASNLVPGDVNGMDDIFLHDRATGTTELVSISTAGALGNGDSLYPSVSADGLYVAFASNASNLAPLDTNGCVDVFLRNRQLGLTTRVSRSSSGSQGNSHSNFPCISADGRYIAFMSQATNLVSGDTNGRDDVFVNDRITAVTERVSVGLAGLQGDNHSTEPSFSADGRLLAFQSSATNLVANGPGTVSSRIYVRDLSTGTNEIASFATNGTDPNNGGCSEAWISADGRYVAFRSPASDLVPGDTNGNWDVFIHDRLASGFTSLCEPGLGSVIACPCGNDSSSAARGCDNSASTGGAALGASGNAYLSIDSLVFTTQFEKPHATSIVLEGDTAIANGVPFGQGVRCVGGQLKRLYVKVAVNGSISAPDLASNDSPVSVRSAQLGVPLLPGVPVFCLVYYRDPTVLGGCPANATFNCTQTGSVTYWP